MSHMGHMVASIADSIMSGQLGELSLAAVGLSVTIYALFALFGIGLVSGLTPLVAKADGEKNEEEKRSLFKHSLIMSIVAGLILSAAMICIIPFMGYMGQSMEVVAKAKPYYIILASTIFFSLIFFHFKQFGEGIHIVKTTMWINIWGNLLNVFLNFVFLKGWFGMPQMGITGIGLATFISRAIMLAALILRFRKSRMRPYMDAYSSVTFQYDRLKNLFINCIPIAFQYIIEMSAFSVGAIMTGWFGSSSLAAHHIAINIISITYLIAAGIGAATSVIVGNGYGEKDMEKIKLANSKSTVMVILIMGCLALLTFMANSLLPSLYLDNVGVIEIASKLLIIAALFQLFDGYQVVGLGVLRGINDLKTPTYIAALSYWIVTIPACYILAVVYDLKAVGVWYGFLLGLLISSSLIYLRIRNRMKLMHS
ncbi:MAG: MATE family multidrug resistance protein [Glaciecola sp.]|jgi:MATE family multidrug resistance protein